MILCARRNIAAIKIDFCTTVQIVLKKKKKHAAKGILKDSYKKKLLRFVSMIRTAAIVYSSRGKCLLKVSVLKHFSVQNYCNRIHCVFANNLAWGGFFFSKMSVFEAAADKSLFRSTYRKKYTHTHEHTQ